jgi:hypothetical protein
MAGLACRERRLVRRHFSHQLEPQEETALRAHLPDCARCRGLYDRHLLYETLVHGDRRPAVDRIAAGLGLGPAPQTPGRALLAPWSLAGLTAAAGLLLIVAVARRHSDSADVADSDRQFLARGRAAVAGHSRIDVYKVHGGDRPVAADGKIAARDELAFAYRNPRAYKHLLLFGVDEDRNVYWFHPAWVDPARPPLAIAIAPGPAPHELGEAVRHELRGRTLRVVGLFTNAPVSVTAVEERVRRGAVDFPNSERSETILEVVP